MRVVFRARQRCARPDAAFNAFARRLRRWNRRKGNG